MANVPWQYQQKPIGKYTEEIRAELVKLDIHAKVFYRQHSIKSLIKKVPAYRITFKNTFEMNLFSISSKWASYKCVELKLGKRK